MSVRVPVLIGVIIVLAGCANHASHRSRVQETRHTLQPVTAAGLPSSEPLPIPVSVQAHPALAKVMSAHVYFDFDQDTIREADQKVVIAQVNYMRAHPETRLRLLGNTDERGSTEYNLALGQRRSYMVRKAMMVLGIDAKRLEAISYGKEKPLSMGHNELAWSKNRRVDFLYY